VGIFKEFRDFAVKGNVLDLAVGFIVGGAFGKIVSSLVSDVLMPPIGALVGGVNFSDIKITLKPEALSSIGKMLPAVTLNIGNFIQSVVDFTIIAFAVFLIVKAVNTLRSRLDKEAAAVPAPAPSEEVLLLKEIRDLLKNKG
jgi:large conductance mechanosensitive channel